MKIYDFPFAPNPRKLRVYLAEKGLQIPFETVNLVNGEQHGEAFRAMNPMGGVPVLVLDDGTVLTESLAIIEYLEELHPEPPMIGTTPLERALVRRLERICEMGVLGRVARYVHNSDSPLPGVTGEPAIAAQMVEELPKPLAVLEAEMGDREFVAANHPTIADCTLFAASEFARFGGLDLFERFPGLARWRDAFAKRPSAQGPA